MILRHILRRTAHPPARRLSGQSGVAALGLAAMMVVFVGTLAGIGFIDDGRNAVLPDAGQSAALRWAEDAVQGFAATQGRLPCPARARGGPEDCGAAFTKGWLPVASIESFAPPTGTRAPLGVRYAVYRGAGAPTGADPDLAVAEDAYQPSTDPGYPRIVSGNLDLCGKLRAVMPAGGAVDRWRRIDATAATTGRVDRAHVASATDPALSARIAYGLAVAPPGTPDAASGFNADASARLEDPLRRLDGSYRDLVRAVDFDTLYQALSCPIALASLDTLAVAATWPDEAVGMRAGTIAGSWQLVKIEGVVVASEIVEVASSGIDTAAAIWTGAKSTQLVAVSIPGLPLSMPAYVSGQAGIVTSALANKMAIIDTARSAVGLGVESAYALTYMDLAKQAEASRVWDSALPLLTAADRQGSTP